MGDVSNEQIYGALLDIKQDIGNLNAKADTTTTWLNQQEVRVVALEACANRQKGAARAMALLAGALGTIGGLLVTWFTKGGH